MKEILESKVMMAFIIFVLSVVYFSCDTQKNVSAHNTDKMLNNYEINQQD